MPYIYLLTCSDGSFYVGSCRNLEHRLWQHQQGFGSDYTRTRRPVRLVWNAELPTVVEAWGMERRIHGWSRAKKQALIDGRFDDLRALSRGATHRQAQGPGE